MGDNGAMSGESFGRIGCDTARYGPKTTKNWRFWANGTWGYGHVLGPLQRLGHAGQDLGPPQGLGHWWQELGPPAGIRQGLGHSRQDLGPLQVFQCLERGLWYLVLVPTST